MSAVVLLPIILQALPSVITGAQHLIDYVRSVRAAAQQSEEWTPEQEEQFLAALKAHNLDPAYLPDLNPVEFHQVKPPRVVKPVHASAAAAAPHPGPLPEGEGGGGGECHTACGV